MKRLVIVESPTKAKTIRGFLPSAGYRIEASRGHVRDLPSNASEIPERYKSEEWARLGVNVLKGFEPLYVIPDDKKAVVKQLKDALKDADELIIATDEDREGESIGWHLVEVLKPKVPVKRMVFHEITKEAIDKALRTTRDINGALVEAQEARRVLDRLVGYSVSPVLWRKVAPKLSAGRVQSVAVRLVVLREWERLTFIPASYWDLKAFLRESGMDFEAQLTHVGPKRVATAKDFDPDTGALKADVKRDQLALITETEARALAKDLAQGPWKVVQVEHKDVARHPAAPFITSTLQQEAARKLSLSSKQTMRVAQALYEQGFITYMRTDSTTLSEEALHAARASVQARYGATYLSPEPRQYANKVRNAQEAHEAIRPAGTKMQSAAELGLTGEQAALYDLIWKRTLASQMANARLRQTGATLDASGRATFRATGQTVLFPGFFRVYVEGTDDPEAALDHREKPLPDLKEGATPRCERVDPLGHETKPPARYTEASLVRMLEKEGIGRPSTYASIMDTIVGRGYIQKHGTALVPTFTAMATVQLLETGFEHLVDTGFTAEMEEALDRIAEGNGDAQHYLAEFYDGRKGSPGLSHLVDEGIAHLDARAISTLKHPKWHPHVVHVGKFGPYVEAEKDGERVSASLPPELAPADLTRDGIERLLEEGSQGDQPLGMHPESDMPIYLRRGPYGYYVQLGDDEQEGKPRRASLPAGLKPEMVVLDKAVELLALPRTLGTHPATGKPILANLGRFGPYVQHGSLFASLTKADDVFTVELPRALELIALKEEKSKPLRVIGIHPVSTEPIEVVQGRWGPYLKCGKEKANLGKDRDYETLTLEEATALLPVAPPPKAKATKAPKTTAKTTAAKATTTKPKTTKATKAAKPAATKARKSG